MYEVFEQLLQKRGVTSYKVAKEAGVTQTALSNWKAGRSTPTTKTLQKIADYFGVTVDYLISGKNDSSEDVRETELSARDERDIAKDLDRIMNEIKKGDDGPMRRGEICALDSRDISGNVVHVCRNMVITPEGTWIVKTPKSYAGDRYIEFPDFVAERWKGISGRITALTPDIITNRFPRILKRAGIPHFRFHDLRHYSASIQHALGIPDAYIMQRGGWGNDGVLKAVYRHAMDSRQAGMNQIANRHFSTMQHEVQHGFQNIFRKSQIALDYWCPICYYIITERK